MTAAEECQDLVCSPCPLCGEQGSLLQVERRNGLGYATRRCPVCGSLYCADHHATVSPDYVGLSPEQITEQRVWLQGAHKRRAYEQLFHVLHRRGRRVSSVLDVGCGTGGFLSFAESRGVAELYGFDASRAQAAHARRTAKTVRESTSVRAYVNALGWTPHWDLITLWDVLEHLRQPRELLREIREFCAPDCAVFVSTPNATAELVKYCVRRAFFRRHSFVPWEHVMYFSLTGLRGLLRECGLEPVHCSGTACYDRQLNAFEAVRRAGFALSRRTALAPQFFVISRPSSSAGACGT